MIVGSTEYFTWFETNREFKQVNRTPCPITQYIILWKHDVIIENTDVK